MYSSIPLPIYCSEKIMAQSVSQIRPVVKKDWTPLG